MKYFIITILLCLMMGTSEKSFASDDLLRTSQSTCVEKSTTDAMTYDCLRHMEIELDKKLNITYTALSKKMDAATFTKIRESQRIWLVFLTKNEKAWHSIFGENLGSLDAVLVQQWRVELYRNRVNELSAMLTAAY